MARILALAAILSIVGACSATDNTVEVVEFDPDSAGDVAASGQRVIDAATFRFRVSDAAVPSDFADMCFPSGTSLVGALDLGRDLSMWFPDDGSVPHVIATDDTVYVRSSALQGWTIGTEWLSVDQYDDRQLRRVSISTGINLASNRDAADAPDSPLHILTGLAESVESTEPDGTDTIRSEEMSRYSVDLASNGPLFGEESPTPTTTSVPTSTTPPTDAELEEYRDAIFEILSEGSPDDDETRATKREAFVAGDVERLIELAGEPPTPDDIAALEGILVGEFEAFARTAGLTDEQREVFEMIAAIHLSPDGLDPFEMLGPLFDQVVQPSTTIWVDATGHLRRFHHLVTIEPIAADPNPEPGVSEPSNLTDLTIDFWDVGEPLSYDTPSDDETTAVDDLSDADIPAQLSPCYAELWSEE